MKLIKAYVRHQKIRDVYNGLNQAGYCCMTIIECEGTGRYSSKKDEHLSSNFPFINTEKIIKIEILIADNHIDQVVEIIRKNGRTDYSGDGMIIISPAENVYKIKTDEEGFLAI
jgi:nitrogen regulatory protein P-II 1